MSPQMTESEILQVILDAIRNVAPETDTNAIHPDLPLRDQVDLDSMDFFHLLVSLEKRFGIRIQESEYSEFTTLKSCIAFVVSRIPRPGASLAQKTGPI